jgi:hypothetical protein
MSKFIHDDADNFKGSLIIHGGVSVSSSNTSAPTRMPLQLEIEYRKSYARKGEHGLLRNISLTGAFLEHTNEELRALDRICITFKVGGRIRKINAGIVWQNAVGCGIKFLPTNNRDVQIVDDLMYFVESSRESRRTVLEDIFKQTG